MPASALALALTAAFVHALWNVLLARARDPEAATVVALVVSIVAYAPTAIVFWELDAAVWPYLAASSLFQLGYVVLLAAAYRRSELSLVYPLARGVAPVLVLGVAVLALGAETSAAQVSGVCLIAAGVLLVRGFRRHADTTGVVLGLSIAAFIAAYTLSDNEGIRHASALTYVELEMIVPTVVYAAVFARLRGAAAIRAELNPASVVAGVATLGAYTLVLLALERAPAAPVAAIRETSVVIAALLAWVVLKEDVRPTRLAGAALVVAGIVLVGA
ncbi:MAG: DMT family transporter [Actinomycetota bacterium]|nr:DMT family transporter [Actinomycetota bacterium]